MRTAFAPGRVNLIGDHTDYTGGLVLPIAVQFGTTVSLEPGGDRVRLVSADRPEPAEIMIDVADPASVTPEWGRYVAGVVAELRPGRGGDGRVATTLPIGAGMSSSAALEIAVALALGFVGSPLELALLAQRAEHRASGVPCGLMDQLVSAAGVEGHALLIDCATNEIEPVPITTACDIVVVDTGERRTLTNSAYAERRAQCEAAAAIVGPLSQATTSDLDLIADPVLRRRARHVVAENHRVAAAAAALRAGDMAVAGRLMRASHESLRADFEVSTPALDALVHRLNHTVGVHGARMTGAGFGGCAVALTEPGALQEGMRVTPSAGAHVFSDG